MLPDPLLLLDPSTLLLTVFSGFAVGLSLSLTGGGGSVLAVPLLIYLIGIRDPHAAIGTSAFVVGIIAAINMISHRFHGNIRFREGLMFALPGVGGTLLGTQLGLLTPASHLLLFFAAFMGFMGFRMLKAKQKGPLSSQTPNRMILLQKNRVLFTGFFVGIAAGYFGIGGGFLIVPALMHSAGLDIISAIGTSLLPVSIFGLSTATRYLVAGQINVETSIPFVLGGIVGGIVGAKFAMRIPRQTLLRIFGILLFLIAIYMAFRVIAG